MRLTMANIGLVFLALLLLCKRFTLLSPVQPTFADFRRTLLNSSDCLSACSLSARRRLLARRSGFASAGAKHLHTICIAFAWSPLWPKQIRSRTSGSEGIEPSLHWRQSNFKKASELSPPAPFGRLFEPIPEELFRHDVSSSFLRERGIQTVG